MDVSSRNGKQENAMSVASDGQQRAVKGAPSELGRPRRENCLEGRQSVDGDTSDVGMDSAQQCLSTSYALGCAKKGSQGCKLLIGSYQKMSASYRKMPVIANNGGNP